MSSENGVNPSAPYPSTNFNFTLISEEIEAHQNHYDDANKVSCIMASSMSPELQKTFENTWAYNMNQQLKEMFQTKASKEHLDVVKSLMACKSKPEASICAFILEKEGYFDRLESLNMMFDIELSINIILSALVLTVGHNAKKRKTSHSKWKGKATQGKYDHGSKRKDEYEIAPTSDPKEAVYFYCNIKGHWKRSCPKYLKDLKDGKVKKGVHSGSKGNNDGNMILNAGPSNELDKSKLWHSRLGHLNKKRIAQLQKDGVLESFDFKSNDVSESCLSGKMTKSPFTRTYEKAEGLLDLVHTDVCGSFRSATKDGKRYYVTFTDDFSRYGYVYLIKHKSDTIEVFKRYQNEVENQLVRKIKVLRSDKGGKYLSIEFFDHLKNYGIVSQLTPPRTPQLNGVCERRNRTLLDMVQSMMCRATFPISFWGYALEKTTHILNLVPTKKVSKTPFEMWKGKQDKISDSTLTELNEPANYNEAMASPEAAKWKEAMKSEIKSMYDNQVWNLVDTTPDFKTMGCKWIFKKKTDMDGKVHTYKARLVAKGYTQTHEIDHEETFSPRMCFMVQQEGFENEKYPKRVCKLKKAIYGLKQASRSWNLCFHEKVTRFGFSRSEDESCVYVKVSGSVVVFLVLYVDDILLIGNDILTLQSVKDWLGRCFAMKDLGDAAYILGIRIYRDRTKRLIGLSQETYLDKLLKRFKMKNSKKGNLPLHHGIKISHWTVVKNILRYLRNTKDRFLVYGGEKELRVTGYCDAGWQTDKDDSRSQSGWVFLLNRGVVTWKSSKQDTVADSTCVSEYNAACEASKEAIWMKNFIGDLGVVPIVHDPIEIFCDNESAVALTKEPKDHGKSKHIERKYHFVRSKVEEGHVIVKDIRSEDNPADPFTKALAKPKHDEHAKSIGLKDKIEF
uniref:Retrotransposon protein, putative, Ty1-copia subclass n=1 Tax=Tanacetum cinerariifolium TaxID=118510 RepID=A0A6L2NTK9_TANCI|nr:retrotransposon protein, putative, Ty1-copia subclass [Tanacetum cinerariifolium]